MEKTVKLGCCPEAAMLLVFREGATEMIRGMEHLPCEERLMELGLFQPGKERVPGTSYCSLSIVKEGLQEIGGQSF